MKNFKVNVVLSGGMLLTCEKEAASAHDAYMMLVKELKENGKEGLLEKCALHIEIAAQD